MNNRSKKASVSDSGPGRMGRERDGAWREKGIE